MSLVHWLVVGGIFILLFGGGKLANLGKDLGEGLRAFKKGIGEEEDAQKPNEPKRIPETIDVEGTEATSSEPKKPDEPEAP